MQEAADATLADAGEAATAAAAASAALSVEPALDDQAKAADDAAPATAREVPDATLTSCAERAAEPDAGEAATTEQAVSTVEVAEGEIAHAGAEADAGDAEEAPDAESPVAREMTDATVTSSIDAADQASAEPDTAEPWPIAAESAVGKSAQLHQLISQARGSQEATAASESPADGGGRDQSGPMPSLGLKMPTATAVPVAQGPQTLSAAPAVSQPFTSLPTVRYLHLNVHPGIGAGLSLRPTPFGMLVEDIEAEPGQPGLNIGDTLVEIGGQTLASLPAEAVKEVFGKEFRPNAKLAVLAPSSAQESDASNSWPEAVEVGPRADPTPAVVTDSARGGTAGTGNEVTAGAGEPAGGLLELVSQLTQQLSNETLRREHEERELQERRKEEARMREELEARRLRRVDVRAAAEDAAKAAEKAKREHADLEQTHQATLKEVSEHESELQELQKAALARNGRDWARDGPEKDALVQTKLQIAEAHDLLHQVRLQLRLNRDGLRRQLSELQTENNRLRAMRQAA